MNKRPWWDATKCNLLLVVVAVRPRFVVILAAQLAFASVDQLEDFGHVARVGEPDVSLGHLAYVVQFPT